MLTAFSCWKGRIAPLFDAASVFVFVRVEEGKPDSQSTFTSYEENVARKIAELAQSGVQELVCGALSRQAAYLLAMRGIAVQSFIGGELPLVMRAWQNNEPLHNRFTLPGCSPEQRKGRHGNRWRGGRHDGARISQNECCCPSCGHREPPDHRGPCVTRLCPLCGAQLVRM